MEMAAEAQQMRARGYRIILPRLIYRLGYIGIMEKNMETIIMGYICLTHKQYVSVRLMPHCGRLNTNEDLKLTATGRAITSQTPVLLVENRGLCGFLQHTSQHRSKTLMCANFLA